MENIKKKFAVFHLFGWLLVFLFFLWMFWGERPSNPLSRAVILLLISSSVFYAHSFLFSRFRVKKSYSLYFAGLAAILFLVPFPFMWVFGLGIEIENTFPVPYVPFFVLSLIFVGLSWLSRAAESWFVNVLIRERLEKQAVQAELAYLKSQINPHFLFNTLNNIHTLAYIQAPSTPDAIRRLSSLMRYMIYESNADRVALSREIEYLHDYISLQELRYEKSPVVEMEIEGDTDSCNIAPLLFIPLLENAYKHSPANPEEGGIQLRIKVNDNNLVLNVRNPCGKRQSKEHEGHQGIGLPNVRKRLQLLYPGQHSLEVNSLEGFFNVDLRIYGLLGHGLEETGKKSSSITV